MHEIANRSDWEDWKENRATRNLSTPFPPPPDRVSRLIKRDGDARQKRTLVCVVASVSFSSRNPGIMSYWRWKWLAPGNSSTATMRRPRAIFCKKKKKKEGKERKKAGRRWRALQGGKMAHRGASGSRLPWMSLAFDRLRRESAIQFYNYEIANGAATLLATPGPAWGQFRIFFRQQRTRERIFERNLERVSYCSSRWQWMGGCGFRLNNFQRLLILSSFFYY